MQRLPLLRGLLRGVPGDGAAARFRQGGSELSRPSLPRLPRLLLRLPIRAAARVRGQRAKRLRAAPRRNLPRIRLAAAACGAVPAQRRRGVADRRRRTGGGAAADDTAAIAGGALHPAYRHRRLLCRDSLGVMIGIGVATFGYALLALAIGFVRFRRDTAAKRGGIKAWQ